MTDKQKRFADEYLIDCNAKRAAIRAGYSPKTAYSIGNENLKKPEIKSYIDELLEKLHDENTADAQEIMEYLTSVMRGQSRSKIIVILGVGEGVSEAVTIEKAPDEKERLKAAELLGKRFGLFKDNLNINAAVPVVITGEDELED